MLAPGKILPMDGKNKRRSRDPIGGLLAVILLLLLAGLIASQVALADPTWRARYSLVDILEGVRPQ